MDDRTWYLARGALLAAVAAVALDAVLGDFDVPSGFWVVLGGVLSFLAARSAIRSRNGNNGG